jgi:hypothetical protein
MNEEAKHELKEIAQDLTYTYIKHSGLAKLISNEEWDLLAERLANQSLIFIEGQVDAEFAKQEAREAA